MVFGNVVVKNVLYDFGNDVIGLFRWKIWRRKVVFMRLYEMFFIVVFLNIIWLFGLIIFFVIVLSIVFIWFLFLLFLVFFVCDCFFIGDCIVIFLEWEWEWEWCLNLGFLLIVCKSFVDKFCCLVNFMFCKIFFLLEVEFCWICFLGIVIFMFFSDCSIWIFFSL